MPDANNNTMLLTDGASTEQQLYAYEPYGRAKKLFNGEDNTQQFTGRENDGTGLYYYRNRYYMPTCARFISEDPIGWASGQTNNYAYVGGNPVQFTDPSGQFGWVGVGVVIGAGLAIYEVYKGYEGLKADKEATCAIKNLKKEADRQSDLMNKFLDKNGTLSQSELDELENMNLAHDTAVAGSKAMDVAKDFVQDTTTAESLREALVASGLTALGISIGSSSSCSGK